MRKKVINYTVYLAEDESVVAFGTASECARMMGMTTNTFYSTVHNTLSGSVNKYEFHREEIQDTANCKRRFLRRNWGGGNEPLVRREDAKKAEGL